MLSCWASARKNYHQNSYVCNYYNKLDSYKASWLTCKGFAIHISFSAYEHSGTSENISYKLLHSISSWIIIVLLFSLKAWLLDVLFSTFHIYLQFYMLMLLYNLLKYLRRKLVSKVTWMIEQFLINCWLSSWLFYISSLIIN